MRMETACTRETGQLARLCQRRYGGLRCLKQMLRLGKIIENKIRGTTG